MIEATEMEGVLLTPLDIISDNRGSVKKMIEAKPSIGGAPPFMDVSEIYFSIIVQDVVKGWHGHEKMTLNYTCIYGRVIVGLCDLRVGKTFKEIAQVYMDDYIQYKLLTIPPGVWNGFRVYPGGSSYAIMANAASHVHDPDEITRIKPSEFPVAFDWGAYDIAG